jgi:hypothetical protein
VTQRSAGCDLTAQGRRGPTRDHSLGAFSGSGSARLGLSQKGGLPTPASVDSFGPRSPTRASTERSDEAAHGHDVIALFRGQCCRAETYGVILATAASFPRAVQPMWYGGVDGFAVVASGKPVWKNLAPLPWWGFCLATPDPSAGSPRVPVGCPAVTQRGPWIRFGEWVSPT